MSNFKKDFKTKKNNLIEILESNLDAMAIDNVFRRMNIIDENEDEIFLEFENKEARKVAENYYVKSIKTALLQILDKRKSIVWTFSKDTKTIKKPKMINSEKNFLNKKTTFKNYVEANFNRNATRAIKSITEENKIQFNPIFIHAQSGFGKTHLLHALGNELVEQERSVIYINPDTFTKKTTDFMQKKDSFGLNKFVELIQEFDVLMFDDVQNFIGRTQTMDIIFNIINHRIENDLQVVFCADESPDELGGFPDRFITRFKGGLSLNIKKPNIDDLIKILKFKLKKSDLEVDKWEKDALKFLAEKSQRSIRDLNGQIAYIKFHKNDLMKINKYNLLVIKSIFKDTTSKRSFITIEVIQIYIAKKYKISVSDLKSKSKKTNISIPRQLAFWLCNELTEKSQKEIGLSFNRDHSTVAYAINKIKNKKKIDESLKTTLTKIKNDLREIQ